MKISIFGLGYVGCVGAACFASMGHKVIGVDVSRSKVDLINAGRPTIIEKDIAGLCEAGHKSGLLSATTDAAKAVADTDISFIAVGTPGTGNGHLDLSYIFAVAREIGRALAAKDAFHVVAIRSTVTPGTNKEVTRILAEESGKTPGVDFAVVSNPEFLREGTSVHDFLNPPLTLVGTDSPRAAATMQELYSSLPGEYIATDISVAEVMKYVNNTFHALKIVFGNEVGSICRTLGIDSHKVMDIFCRDRVLNISPYYFKPGFAYGGSCLPKDTAALCALAADNGVDAPVISHISSSNDAHRRRALDLIMAQGRKKIGILGLSFKAGTDDLRCSPVVEVVNELVKQGYDIAIYDRTVQVSRITGTNRDFIMSRIPHLQHLITDDLDAVASQSDVLVVTNREKEFADIPARYPGKTIVDLIRMWNTLDYDGRYEGLAWPDINTAGEGKEPVENLSVAAKS